MEGTTKPKPARRRRAVGGGASLSFVLGMCVAVGFCIVCYHIQREQNPPPTAIEIDVPEKEADPPPRPAPPPVRPVKDNRPAKWDIDSKLDIEVGKPRLGPRAADSGPDKPGPGDEHTTPPQVKLPKPPKKDHIVSATKCEKLLVSEYRMLFHDRPGSYYLLVKLKSYNRERWGMSEDEWYNQKAMTRAVSRGGGSYKCFQMWPMLVPDEGCIVVKMAFVVPSSAAIREIRIGQERWPIDKIVNSGN